MDSFICKFEASSIHTADPATPHSTTAIISKHPPSSRKDRGWKVIKPQPSALDKYAPSHVEFIPAHSNRGTRMKDVFYPRGWSFDSYLFCSYQVAHEGHQQWQGQCGPVGSAGMKHRLVQGMCKQVAITAHRGVLWASVYIPISNIQLMKMHPGIARGNAALAMRKFQVVSQRSCLVLC